MEEQTPEPEQTFIVTPEQLCQWGIQFDPDTETQVLDLPPAFVNNIATGQEDIPSALAVFTEPPQQYTFES